MLLVVILAGCTYLSEQVLLAVYNQVSGYSYQLWSFCAPLNVKPEGHVYLTEKVCTSDLSVELGTHFLTSHFGLCSPFTLKSDICMSVSVSVIVEYIEHVCF